MLSRSLLVVAALLIARPAVADEPAFNGKPLSGWLAMLKDDPLPRKRRAAVVALGQIVADHPDSRGTILPALGRTVRNDSQPTVRSAAASVLGQQAGDKPELFFADAVEALRIEKESEVRRELAVCFGRVGPRAAPAVQALVAVLSDPDPTARAAAADALGRIGPEAKAAAPALAKLAADGDRRARRGAAFALGRIETEDKPTAAAALAEVLAVEQVTDARLSAVAAVAGGAWAVGRDSDAVQTAVISLGLLNDRSARTASVLASCMVDPDPEVRRQSALSLAKLGSGAKPAQQNLTVVTRTDADRFVRIYAVHALSAAFADDPKPLLSLFAERLRADSDFEVRVAVAVELGGFGESANGAISALRDAQRDPQLKVREAATAALRQIQKAAGPGKP